MKLTNEQIEYVTDIMHGIIIDISNETGFVPEYDDILKCLDYALKSAPDPDPLISELEYYK